MDRDELLKILQNETGGFAEQSRLRDDVLDALEKVQEQAINYRQCCTELKDKKEMTFDEWIKENNYRKVYKGYARNQIHFGDEEMLQRYNYYKRLL